MNFLLVYRLNEMKKRELYCIFAVCSLILSSCLGDTNTRITVGEQEAVYQTRPTSGFYVNKGRFLYGSNLGVSGDNGDCFLIEYSFDSSSPELQETDSLSIELLGNPRYVDLWPLDNRMTDTLIVLDNEVLTESILGRKPYINGRLFLWTNHTELQNQVDSFMISYNPEQPYTTVNNSRIYNLYLRAVKIVEEEGGEEGAEETVTEGTKVRVLRTNAFNLEEFINTVSQTEEQLGGDTLRVAINYVSAYNKDTTACLWSATEPINFELNSRTE